jgi:uncharacterized membrane protein
MSLRSFRPSLWVSSLWWGSLTAVGFGVVPMLFANLPTPAMAGAMAAKLFSALTWVTVVCGLILLLSLQRNKSLAHSNQAQEALIFIVSGMLLALLSEFAVAPLIVARENLRLWHSVGTLMYAVQWVCAGITLAKVNAGQKTDQSVHCAP